MPHPGDQHQGNRATTNPFLEQRQHVSEYTAEEIAILQSRLDRQLGPEYISTRPGGGGTLHYLAAEKAINLANEVFGFNGWSSAVQNVTIDFIDENSQNGKISLGLSTIVRVTLRDGTFHEDVGYGHIENCKGKAAAFEKAKKESVTDALKRALRNFGNLLGNCLYDKEYLQKISRVKVAPSKWDAGKLHRHPDFAPIDKEPSSNGEVRKNGDVAPRRHSSVQSGASFGSGEFEDDFGGNIFDETDFTNPDEVRLEGTIRNIETPAKRAINGPQNTGEQRQSLARTHSMPQMRPPNINPPPPIPNPQAPPRPQGPQTLPVNAAQANRMPPPQMNNQQRPEQTTHSDGTESRSNSSSATSATSPSNRVRQQTGPPQQTNGDQSDGQSFPVQSMPPPGNPEGFVTGRSAAMLNESPDNGAATTAIRPFNPHADSPSIRRTHGVNPGKSAPVSRQALNGAVAKGNVAPQPQSQPTGNGNTTPVKTNFVNPAADPNRRIGMPQSAAPNPVQNRNAYRPPSAAAKRPPLSDVSNLHQMDGADEAKRTKLDPAVERQSEGQTLAPAPAAS